MTACIGSSEKLFAEGVASIIPHLAAAATGVVKGRPTLSPAEIDAHAISNDHPDLPWVKAYGSGNDVDVETPPYLAYMTSVNPNGAVRSSCTSIFLDGCFLTAAHCPEEGYGQQFYFGSSFEDKHLPAPNAVGGRMIRYPKGEKDPRHDLAVIKPSSPVVESEHVKSLPFSVISEKEPKLSDLITLAGFGLSESVWDPSTRKYVNVGSGTLRTGTSRVYGIGGLPGERGKEFAGKEHSVIYAWPYPHKIAPGDSGGGAWHEGKLYGVASFVQIPHGRTVEFSEDSGFSSLPENYTWVKNAFLDLGCGKFSAPVVGKRLKELLTAQLHRGQIQKDVNALSPEEKETLKSLASRWAGFKDSRKNDFRISYLDGDQTKAHFKITSEEGVSKEFSFVPELAADNDNKIIRYQTLPRPN